MTHKVVTIGVYGYSEHGFFDALARAGVDTFCDIRYRRGVRGSDYAFANSNRLQARLAEMRIRYIHRRDLAPSPATRRQQTERDRADGVKKRDRASLGVEFMAGYATERLSTFDSLTFLESLGDEAKVIALFCVEREPAACHRSLLAERLRQDLGLTVEHILS